MYDHWRRWKKRGGWAEAVLVLNTRAREEKRGRRAPRPAILDSRSIKTAAEGRAPGFHGGKKVKGRSRHVAVASRGTLLAVSVTAARVSDSSQAGTVMRQAKENGPTLESFTADQGFRRQAQAAAHAPDGEWLTTHKPKKKGCALIAFRRRVERTFAWLAQCRLLAKDYEKTVASAEAWIWCAMLRWLVRRLA